MPIYIVSSTAYLYTDARVNEKKSSFFDKKRPSRVKAVKREGAQLFIDVYLPVINNVEDAEYSIETCYKNAMKAAYDNGVNSVLFPLFAANDNVFSKEKLLRIAEKAISDSIDGNEMTVYIDVGRNLLFSKENERFAELNSYINSKLIVEDIRIESIKEASKKPSSTHRNRKSNAMLSAEAEFDMMPAAFAMPEGTVEAKHDSLAFALEQIDESFSEMLLRKIDEEGMTDAECYKKANIDRKLFSKIRSDKLYRPSKATAIAFAVALELSLEETKEMLMKAGFALSHSSKFDIIIEYYISNGIYDIFEINEALFAFDQNLLGA
jgi:hypothetical protein